MHTIKNGLFYQEGRTEPLVDLETYKAEEMRKVAENILRYRAIAAYKKRDVMPRQVALAEIMNRKMEFARQLEDLEKEPNTKECYEQKKHLKDEIEACQRAATERINEIGSMMAEGRRFTMAADEESAYLAFFAERFPALLDDKDIELPPKPEEIQVDQADGE
jgi:hypothetical protein